MDETQQTQDPGDTRDTPTQEEEEEAVDQPPRLLWLSESSEIPIMSSLKIGRNDKNGEYPFRPPGKGVVVVLFSWARKVSN